jgi:hypothetical protein
MIGVLSGLMGWRADSGKRKMWTVFGGGNDYLLCETGSDKQCFIIRSTEVEDADSRPFLFSLFFPLIVVLPLFCDP